MTNLQISPAFMIAVLCGIGIVTMERFDTEALICALGIVSAAASPGAKPPTQNG